MKKTLLSILCAFISIFCVAQTQTVYTEPLIVTINGDSSEPQPTDVVVVDNGDGTINFTMKNFFLIMEGNAIPIGNIALENLPVTEGEDGLKHFTFEGPLMIQPGDTEGVDMWMGPVMCAQVGAIPLKFREAKMNNTKMYAFIDIDMQSTLGQVLEVQYGTDDFPPQIQTVYTEPLIVTINGDSSEPQPTDVVVVDNGDGTINFTMKNFFLVMGGESMPIGNIALENLPVTEGEDGLKHFTFEGPMMIQPGDTEGVDMWMGPMMCAQVGAIPLKFREAKMNDTKMYAFIDIDMQSTIGQVLEVQFGTDDFSTTIKGDLNADNKVDIADAVTVLNIMSAGIYNADADVNADQKVDIADFVTVLNIMAAE